MEELFNDSRENDDNEVSLDNLEKTQNWLFQESRKTMHEIKFTESPEKLDILFKKIRELRARNLNLKKDLDKIIF